MFSPVRNAYRISGTTSEIVPCTVICDNHRCDETTDDLFFRNTTESVWKNSVQKELQTFAHM
jgi:hypothetical protein